MSDIDETETPIVVEEEEITDLNSAIRKVMKNAMYVDGLVRGLHETAKALDGGRAQVVFLAESCNEAVYKKLVQGLCQTHNVPLVDVPDNKQLGEWAGLCKIDKDGNARKVVGASCVCICDYGAESEALTFLSRHISA